MTGALCGRLFVINTDRSVAVTQTNEGQCLHIEDFLTFSKKDVKTQISYENDIDNAVTLSVG